jgi:hypothetical protein
MKSGDTGWGKRACMNHDSPFPMNEGNGIILVEVVEVGKAELDLGMDET